MARSEPTAARPPGTRIAIVDDDDLFRESLGLNLADEGYQVVDFADGQAAVEYFLAGDGADVMLLDWRMPTMDGPTTLRRLRDADIAVPVIFLTVHGGDHRQHKAAIFQCRNEPTGHRSLSSWMSGNSRAPG